MVLVLAASCVMAAFGAPANPATSRESTGSGSAAHKKSRQPAKTAPNRAASHPAGRTVVHATKQTARQPSERKQAGRAHQGLSQASSRQSSRSRQSSPSRRNLKFRSGAGSRPGARPRLATRVHATVKPRPAAEPIQIARADQPARLHPAAEPEPAPRTDSDASDSSSTPVIASLPKTRSGGTPPLRGSFESLARQNEKTEADSLERIEDEDDLNDRIARKMLVPVPASANLAVNGNLPENHRYCRPWTASFLSDLARAHAAEFHRPLEVSSAVRTVEYQKRLMETNGNAAAAEGDIASPHLTGATIDIAKQGMSRRELSWMRATLLPLQTAGKLDVEEEFQQLCFHITVYKSYVPARPPRKTSAPERAAKAATPAPAGPTQATRRKPGQSKPAQPKPFQPRPEQPSSEPLPSSTPPTAAAEGL